MAPDGPMRDGAADVVGAADAVGAADPLDGIPTICSARPAATVSSRNQSPERESESRASRTRSLTAPP
jgi:hypothetical protein